MNITACITCVRDIHALKMKIIYKIMRINNNAVHCHNYLHLSWTNMDIDGIWLLKEI
jgi:hypothetical protein